MAYLNGKEILFSPKLVVVEGGGDYDQGYNDGYVEGEKEGYNTGYNDGWDFGENSGTKDGFEVGVGMGEDVQAIMVGTVYASGDFDETFPITIDNPKRLIITVTEECFFNLIELLDADDNSYVLAEALNLEAGTHTLDIEVDGQKQIYLSGFYGGIVGVSVTNRMSYADGVEDGKQAEYDAFWDGFQRNGTLRNYTYALSGGCWNKSNFTPKYDIRPTTAEGIFRTFNSYTAGTFDLVEHLAGLGVELDFSECTVMQYTFYYAAITRVGVIDCTASNWSLTHTFSYSNIETIDKLIVNETNTFTNTFNNQSKLKNITVEGTIANNGIDVHWATELTHDSIMSFINALKDYSGTSTTRSITFGDTNLAKLTDAEKAIATQKGWTLA